MLQVCDPQVPAVPELAFPWVDSCPLASSLSFYAVSSPSLAVTVVLAGGLALGPRRFYRVVQGQSRVG